MTKKKLIEKNWGIFLMAAMTLSIGGCALDEEGGTSSNGNTSVQQKVVEIQLKLVYYIH